MANGEDDTETAPDGAGGKGPGGADVAVGDAPEEPKPSGSRASQVYVEQKRETGPDGRRAHQSKLANDWWRGAVIYQIYPRSFMDSSGDGVGDLNGIAQRLDHVKSLGVDGIWLSPFFKSPMRDFGYDVSDYRAVDPLFGSLADFDAVLKAAHQRDLKVIIDQVWSHTSSDHPWFAQSRKSRDWQAPRMRLVGSEEGVDRRDWYVWADPKPDGSPPNNWQAWFGGPAWTWEPRRRQYYLHNFLPTQPDLNLRHPDVQDAILDVARFWLDRGVDGFRLDVANYYVHDAQLRDNPPSSKPDPALPRDMQIHQFNSDQPETLDFLARVRALTDSYDGRMMVGELAPGGHALMAQYTAGQLRLHTAYAFDFLGQMPDVARFGDILSQWREGAEDGWPSWAFSNHDVTRVATRWQMPAETSLALLLCLRGTAFIYQGEELGLTEAELEFYQIKDPWGIAGWPATKGRDGCRTPMPWAFGPRGGFTTDTATPWLPVPLEHRRASVAEQEQNAGSFLQRARALIGLRRSSAALREGGFRLRQSKNGVLAFERVHDGERMLCAFNIGGETGGRISGRFGESVRGDLLWAHGARLDSDDLTIDAGGGAIVRLG